jgi:hypothetical protein
MQGRRTTRTILFAAALVWASGVPASAAFYGEVAAFAFKFCPKGWQPADGSLRRLMSDTTMFSLIGNEYGGEYPETFRVPELNAYPPTLPDSSAKDSGKLTWCIRMRDGIYPPRPD